MVTRRKGRELRNFMVIRVMFMLGLIVILFKVC
jgi:hypothetical protein